MPKKQSRLVVGLKPAKGSSQFLLAVSCFWSPQALICCCKSTSKALLLFVWVRMARLQRKLKNTTMLPSAFTEGSKIVVEVPFGGLKDKTIELADFE